MPFEIGSFINGGAGRISGSPAFRGILRNPIFTALLVTALAMVIIYAMFRRELRQAGGKKVVKTGIWLLLGVSAVVFLHYYVVDGELKQSSRQRLAQDTVSTIYSAEGGFGGTHYPVLGGQREEAPLPVEERPGPARDETDEEALRLVDMPMPESRL